VLLLPAAAASRHPLLLRALLLLRQLLSWQQS
jgi:hypothetical protein